MQGAQHEPVAAERDDYFGLIERHFGVARADFGERRLRFVGAAGDEGNRFIGNGTIGHGNSAQPLCRDSTRNARIRSA